MQEFANVDGVIISFATCDIGLKAICQQKYPVLSSFERYIGTLEATSASSQFNMAQRMEPHVAKYPEEKTVPAAVAGCPRPLQTPFSTSIPSLISTPRCRAIITETAVH